ncbi:MAG: AAA family ATPase [Bryobacteraceae bacterium]
MITLVEALRYRSLRYARLPLGRVTALAGPNGSGKAAFLDIPLLCGRLVSGSLEAAVYERASDFRDLLWRREGVNLELAIEAAVPEALRTGGFDCVRYEIALGTERGAPAILAERLVLRTPAPEAAAELFEPATILTTRAARNSKTIVHKGANDNFYDETERGWDHSFRLGPRRAALGHLPDDESKFPVATWFRDLLATGVRRPPQPAAASLEVVREALPQVASVHMAAGRPVVSYQDGFETSLLSEGTRRVLSLAAACEPGYAAVLLVDKPETALDSRALHAVCRALRAAPCQVVVSTHSRDVIEWLGGSVLLFGQIAEPE